jgi:hypothetical protein
MQDFCVYLREGMEGVGLAFVCSHRAQEVWTEGVGELSIRVCERRWAMPDAESQY